MRTATRRLSGAAAVVALAIGTAVLAQSGGSAAAPGDPLPTFGTGGRLDIGVPPGCTACPTAASVAGGWKLATGGTRTIVGHDWSTDTAPAAPPPPADPTDPPSRPVRGAALAVTDGGATPWVVPLEGPSGTDPSILAVGYQPAPARIVAVVALVTRDTTPGGVDDVPLRTEVRRYTTAGVLDTTTTLPAGIDGTWSLAAVAPDGSVVGVVEDTSGPDDLPVATVRRYGTNGALRWTKALPVGDAFEQVAVTDAGQVVLAGSRVDVAAHAFDGLVTALTDAGALDPAFGTGGSIALPAPSGFGRAIVAVTASGTDLAVAGVDQPRVDDPEADTDTDALPGGLVVGRIHAGQLLASFGGDGLVERRWSATEGARTDPTAVLLDGSQVVVAGTDTEVGGSTNRASLTRYLGTGGVDGTFQIDGSTTPALTALAPTAGGYVAATPTDPAAASWAVTLRAYSTAGTSPAGPPAPATPTVTKAGAGTAGIAWIAPSGSPTGYDVLVDAGGDGSVDATSSVPPSTTADLSGLQGGRAYRFAVRARNGSGLGARSAWSATVVPPFRTVDAFTDRQYRDLAGRAPTASELAAWRSAVAAGSLTPLAAADGLVDGAYWGGTQAPVIRLYQAYFKRLPDSSGMAHWVGAYRSGTSLSAISQSFAGSSEFKRTYGSLSNRAFVELVYQNVLGRPGEPSGVDYWTGKLDAKAKTRGAVMVSFSESSENKRVSKPLTDVVDVYTGLLRRLPTAGEVALWKPRLQAGAPRTDLIASILGSSAYAARTAP